MQKFLTKFHTWSQKIITFECSDNYSGIQQKFHVQLEKFSKTQNACGTRDIAFGTNFLSQFIFWMLHLKEKQTTFPSSYSVLLQERQQEPLVCYSNTYRNTLPVCIGHRSLNAGVRNAWRPENDEFSLVYRKLRNLSAGYRDLWTFSKKRLVVYQHLAVIYQRLFLPFL